MDDTQQSVDAKAIREKRAIGMNSRGGKYDGNSKSDEKNPPPFNPPKLQFKGIKIHDYDTDTWGVG